MAVTYAKDRYPWSTGEVVRAAFLAVLTLVAFFGGLAIDAQPIAYVGGALLAFLTLFYIGANVWVKNKRTLNVEMNDESGYFNAWLTKDNKALWGDKLKRDRNQGSLHELAGIGYQHVGIYGVYVFSLKGGKNLYLPERGLKPEIAKFVHDWVMGPMKGTVRFLDNEAQPKLTEAGALPRVPGA